MFYGLVEAIDIVYCGDHVRCAVHPMKPAIDGLDLTVGFFIADHPVR